MAHDKSEKLQIAERKRYWVSPVNLVKEKISLCDHARSKLLYNELAPIFLLAIARDTQKETDFLNAVIRKFLPEAKNVVDLGCGVGRHDELLRRIHKFEVTGIDASESMIEQARKTCPHCKYYVMDFRSIGLRERFDAAFCMWTTFNYLSDAKEVKIFFREMQKILSKKGLLVIDMNNYGRSESTCYTRTSGDEKYHLTVNITKSRIGNLSEALYSYSLKDLKTGKECCFEDQELNRVYTLEEVVIASRPYFELIACFGDYDLQAKFDPYNSERIVMVFQIKGGGL